MVPSDEKRAAVKAPDKASAELGFSPSYWSGVFPSGLSEFEEVSIFSAEVFTSGSVESVEEEESETTGVSEEELRRETKVFKRKKLAAAVTSRRAIRPKRRGRLS